MRRTLPLAIVAVAALAGCGAPPPTPASSSAPETTSVADPISSTDSLCSLDVVLVCEQLAGVLYVTVAAEATDADVIALASDLRNAADHEQLGGAVLQREVTTLIAPISEYSTPPPWSTDVLAVDTAQQTADVVASLLAVEDVPGVVMTDARGTWPSVVVDDVATMPAAFAGASALPLFADGGSYQLLSFDDRLRIEHTPRWVTPIAVEAVVALAVAYPEAEVLLEAMAGGEAAPTLYVARLTTTQLAEVEAFLADPAYAGASLTGGVPYVLTTYEGAGATVTGAFGA